MPTRSDPVINVLSEGAPHSALIVDAWEAGPLVGAHRLRRLAPFAIASTLSVIVAAPTGSWARPQLLVAGCAGIMLGNVIAAVVPWARLPRRMQLVPPVVAVIATLMLVTATGTDFSSPFVTMTVLPLVWLAIYENRWAVVSIGTATGLFLWLLVPVGDAVPSSRADISVIVFVLCAVGMGATLQDLIADSRRVAGALRKQRAAFENSAMMLDVLPEHVSRYRARDHVITYCNIAWAEQYSTLPEVAIGQPLENFLSDDEVSGLTSQLARLGPDSPVLEDVAPRTVAHDAQQWLHWIDRYLVGEDGVEILSIGRDVTARHIVEARLAASEEKYRELADKSADVVWHFTLEPTPHFDYMSPSVDRILGYPPSYFLEDFCRMLDIVDESSRAAISRALNGERALGRFDFHFRHADGSTVIGETRTTLVRDGLQGVSRDVTELRRLQASVAELALRDPLTGLANRRLLDELLEADLARTARDGLTLAIAFLDLDGFKQVNDTHGHSAGDRVLCETARRLLAVVRGADIVARVGGDEFVVVFELDGSNLERFVERIDQTLSAPFDISDTISMSCPASIGVATTDSCGYERIALLAAADRAMYEVKRSHV